jgi:hypothetical protein
MKYKPTSTNNNQEIVNKQMSLTDQKKLIKVAKAKSIQMGNSIRAYIQRL